MASESRPPLPTLSVVMPNYNHGRFIGEALDAILSQSVAPSEVIVVDDASTDDSVTRIEAIAVRHPLVRLLRNERNRGVMASVNRGIAEAAGDFILSAAADDRVLPGLFEKSLRLLADHSAADICFSDLVFLDADSGEAHPKHLRFGREARYFSPREFVEWLPRSEGSIPGSGALFRRSALAAAGGFRESLRWHCDWFASLTLAFRGGCCYVPEPLSSLRFVGGSYSSGSFAFPAQREVLANLLDLLESEAFADVREAFYRSGVLAVFGLPLLRVVLLEKRLRHLTPRLPFRGIARRTAKDVLIRSGSHGLRKAYWELRHRWQTSRG